MLGSDMSFWQRDRLGCTTFRQWSNADKRKSGLHIQFTTAGIAGTVHFPGKALTNLRKCRTTCNMMDVFAAAKLGSNSHRAGAIPASVEWQRWVELYEALPWDNEDDLDNVIKQLQHQQNAHNWKTRTLRTVTLRNVTIRLWVLMMLIKETRHSKGNLQKQTSNCRIRRT